MIKVVLIFILVLSCISIGILISNYFKKRKQFFNELTNLLGLISDHIKYGNEKISQIVKKCSKSNYEFTIFLERYLAYIENKISKDEFFNHIQKTLYFLSEQEVKLIYEIFESLGDFDENGELNKLELSKKKVEDMLKTSTNDKNKFSPFFIKLSVLLGLFLFIIFI